jgi:hypothetical protein
LTDLADGAWAVAWMAVPCALTDEYAQDVSTAVGNDLVEEHQKRHSVDMDLAHRIELKEGEKEAKDKAPAGIARARV